MPCFPSKHRLFSLKGVQKKGGETWSSGHRDWCPYPTRWLCRTNSTLRFIIFFYCAQSSSPSPLQTAGNEALNVLQTSVSCLVSHKAGDETDLAVHHQRSLVINMTRGPWSAGLWSLGHSTAAEADGNYPSVCVCV